MYKHFKKNLLILISMFTFIFTTQSALAATNLCANARSGCQVFGDIGHGIGKLQTKSWSFHCSEEYPYFFAFKNASDKHVTAIFKMVSRSTPHKIDFIFTNWTIYKKHFGLQWSCTKKLEM